ncbi:ABC transporter ATP-binding protein [Tumebacillus permanentifrigoris]|uniref:Peptide/nickel transport system ATP-binding protein/oligopeptide transport system ATP-binding protein n=1 Tax=Tumebacillus permanentifrigoris TaxID=378543 RepID=A0A316D5Y0_9BACL|nr:dipeptide ABC transporter ATP-binding protein [Tumebacillus permanentifrigoris]PWK09583.1 peptide/nickel transport system ATP-binding protein/oligopeptide transport system ATP-binding protein [Tumebacillus permanentifrigoris]
MSRPILQVRDLNMHFPVKKGLRQLGTVRAVDGLSFDLYEGETLALVGESGCGKSTTGRAVLRLIDATDGSIQFQGEEVREMSRSRLFQLRREMQIVFQDAYSFLNPRLTIGESILEAMEVHGLHTKQQRADKLSELLDIVGLNDSYAGRYPHEISGGQRQRIGIARALSLHPKVIVADEPVSALDVSVQSQVLNLFQDLKDKFGLSYLFISHDLSVVRHVADRVAVMYLGKIVETGTADELFDNPQHPYTQALLSAVPQPEVAVARERIILRGEVPSPMNPPSGCAFHTRCPIATQRCQEQVPALAPSAAGTLVACHHVEGGNPT